MRDLAAKAVPLPAVSTGAPLTMASVLHAAPARRKGGITLSDGEGQAERTPTRPRGSDH